MTHWVLSGLAFSSILLAAQDAPGKHTAGKAYTEAPRTEAWRSKDCWFLNGGTEPSRQRGDDTVFLKMDYQQGDKVHFNFQMGSLQPVIGDKGIPKTDENGEPLTQEKYENARSFQASNEGKEVDSRDGKLRVWSSKVGKSDGLYIALSGKKAGQTRRILALVGPDLGGNPAIHTEEENAVSTFKKYRIELFDNEGNYAQFQAETNEATPPTRRLKLQRLCKNDPMSDGFGLTLNGLVVEPGQPIIGMQAPRPPAKDAFNGKWPAFSVGQTQDKAYLQAVEGFQNRLGVQLEAAKTGEFKNLWEYKLQEQLLSALGNP